MPVPERIPLAAPDDGIQRVVLQQQHAARGDPGHSPGERGGLIRGVHQPETVEHHIGRLTLRHRREPAASQQSQPRAAVRAAVLRHPAAAASRPARGDPGHGVGGLRHQGGRLSAPRLLGHRRVGHQLRQAAR